jgi:hypothetical protein
MLEDRHIDFDRYYDTVLQHVSHSALPSEVYEVVEDSLEDILYDLYVRSFPVSVAINMTELFFANLSKHICTHG